MISVLSAASSVSSILVDLLLWAASSVAALPGRVGDLADRAVGYADSWGLTGEQTAQHLAGVSVRLLVTIVLIVLVCAVAALVSWLWGQRVTTRQRAATPRGPRRG